MADCSQYSPDGVILNSKSKMGLWHDHKRFRENFFDDGWATPNTYCKKFRPLISGSAVYLLLVVKTDTFSRSLVAYIGMSERLRQRISGHNILPLLDQPGFWTMVWFKPTPRQLLREVESDLIAKFNPPWNIQGRSRGVALQ